MTCSFSKQHTCTSTKSTQMCGEMYSHGDCKKQFLSMSKTTLRIFTTNKTPQLRGVCFFIGTFKHSYGFIYFPFFKKFSCFIFYFFIHMIKKQENYSPATRVGVSIIEASFFRTMLMYPAGSREM